MSRMLQYLAVAATAVIGASATDCSAVKDYSGMTAEKFAGMLPPCSVSTSKTSY